MKKLFILLISSLMFNSLLAQKNTFVIREYMEGIGVIIIAGVDGKEFIEPVYSDTTQDPKIFGKKFIGNKTKFFPINEKRMSVELDVQHHWTGEYEVKEESHFNEYDYYLVSNAQLKNKIKIFYNSQVDTVSGTLNFAKNIFDSLFTNSVSVQFSAYKVESLDKKERVFITAYLYDSLKEESSYAGILLLKNKNEYVVEFSVNNMFNEFIVGFVDIDLDGQDEVISRWNDKRYIIYKNTNGTWQQVYNTRKNIF